MPRKIQTPRFGAIEVADDAMFKFPEGLLGFGDLREYALLENPGGGPFKWLQSLEAPALAFVLANPADFFPAYHVTLRKEELGVIELDDAKDGYVFVILTVAANVEESTANLQGPVILNTKKRLGKQIVLGDPQWSTRHRLIPGGGA